MLKTLFTIKTLTYFLALLVACFCLFIVFRVPPHTDEYFQYGALACLKAQANPAWGFFWQCDHRHDLILFGHRLPLRTWTYVGSGSSWYYYPWYKLWPNYLSARLMGCFSFSLFVFFFWRLFRYPLWFVLGGVGLCFPLAYQIIADTGPVGFQLVTFLAVPWLLSRYKGWVSPVLAGVLIFLGMEIKPVFALIMPGLFLFIVLYFGRDKITSRMDFKPLIEKRFLLRLLLVGVVSGTLGGIFFTQAMTLEGEPLYQVLLNSARFAVGEGREVKIWEVTKVWEHLNEGMVVLFKSLSNYAHRVFRGGFNSDVNTKVFWAIVFIVLGFSVQRFRRARVLLPLGLILGAALNLYLIVKQPSSWAAHHVILVWPLLVSGYLFGLYELVKARPRFGAFLFVLLILCNLFAEKRLVNRLPKDHSDYSRIAISRYFEKMPASVTNQFVYFLSDFGMFHIFTLYAAKEGELVLQPAENWLNPGQVKVIKKIVDESGKIPILIGEPMAQPNNTSLFLQALPPMKIIPIPGNRPSAHWQVWVPEKNIGTIF
jgi:hypothetical protein